MSELKKEVPCTERDEDAESGPATLRFADIEEEADEINPEKKERAWDNIPPEVVRLVACTVPVANNPPTVEVPEVRELPWIARAVVVPAVEVPTLTCPANVEANVVEVAVIKPTCGEVVL
mgnify:CR=1 FL=1